MADEGHHHIKCEPTDEETEDGSIDKKGGVRFTGEGGQYCSNATHDERNIVQVKGVNSRNVC